jgi:hypothetical protein
MAGRRTRCRRQGQLGEQCAPDEQVEQAPDHHRVTSAMSRPASRPMNPGSRQSEWSSSTTSM